MANSVTYDGMTIRVGDQFVITERGRKSCCRSLMLTDIVTIGNIRNPKDGPEANIGIIAPRDIKGFHNLDGFADENRGYYFRMQEFLIGNFKPAIRNMVVACPWKFKGREFKGRKCRFLSFVTKNFAYVEFEENVGGGTADGLGKAGHCVVVPYNILKTAKEAKTKSKKKGKSNG